MTATRLQWFTVPLAVPLLELTAEATARGLTCTALIKFVLSHRMPSPPVAALEWEYLRGQGYEDFPVNGRANSGPLGYPPRFPCDPGGTRSMPPYYNATITARELALARVQAVVVATSDLATAPRPAAMSAAIHRAIRDHLADPAATWLLPFYPWGAKYPP